MEQRDFLISTKAVMSGEKLKKTYIITCTIQSKEKKFGEVDLQDECVLISKGKEGKNEGGGRQRERERIWLAASFGWSIPKAETKETESPAAFQTPNFSLFPLDP